MVQATKKINKLKKGGSYEALQLEGRPTLHLLSLWGPYRYWVWSQSTYTFLMHNAFCCSYLTLCCDLDLWCFDLEHL